METAFVGNPIPKGGIVPDQRTSMAVECFSEKLFTRSHCAEAGVPSPHAVIQSLISPHSPLKKIERGPVAPERYTEFMKQRYAAEPINCFPCARDSRGRGAAAKGPKSETISENSPTTNVGEGRTSRRQWSLLSPLSGWFL